MTTMRLRNMRATRANCASKGELFFSEMPLDILSAKIVCETCPLRKKCLEFALDNDISYGVWGGTDFDDRTRICPVCLKNKHPERLGCTPAHTLVRLARLLELQEGGDRTISVSQRNEPTAATSPGCLQPRGRSHSTAKAYREGCRCQAAREALKRERAGRAPAVPREPQTELERFMELIEVDGDHWWWRGGKNGSGYGNFWSNSKVVRAHIFAYTEIIGPIPDKARLRAQDECAGKGCANPHHFALTGVPA